MVFDLAMESTDSAVGVGFEDFPASVGIINESLFLEDEVRDYAICWYCFQHVDLPSCFFFRFQSHFEDMVPSKCESVF